MLNNHRLLWSGTFAATLYWFLSEMLNPILSLYASSLNYSTLQISLIFAAQTFIPFFLTIQVGYFSDRIGQRNMLAIGAGFMMLGSMILLFLHQFSMFILAETLVGFGHIAVWLSSQSMVTFIDTKFREKAIARMSFFTAFGQLTGPLLGGVMYSHFNYQFVLGLYFLLSFGFILTYPFSKISSIKSNDPPITPNRISFLESYKIGGQLYISNRGVRVATLISFSLAFILFIRVTYLPLYLEKLHYNPTKIGLFIALWSLASIIIRFFSANLMDRYGRLRMTVVSLMLSFLGLIGFTVFNFSGGLIISLILAGVGTGLNQPLAISLLSISTNQQNRGLGIGLRLMSNRLANWLSPLTLGAASHFFGLPFAFAVVSLPLAVISYSSIRQLIKLPISDNDPKKKGVGKYASQ